jgi:putative sterol carrier protein
MPVFPSEEWVKAWVALANGSAEFEASGKEWEGAVALVIEPDRPNGVDQPLYVRLEGRHGKWISSDVGWSSALAENAVFLLRARYGRWKDVVKQELHPIRGLLQGKLRVEGHLPAILKWMDSMAILAELAGRIETEFADEQSLGPAARATDGT